MLFPKVSIESAHLGSTYVGHNIVVNIEYPWYGLFFKEWTFFENEKLWIKKKF